MGSGNTAPETPKGMLNTRAEYASVERYERGDRSPCPIISWISPRNSRWTGCPSHRHDRAGGRKSEPGLSRSAPPKAARLISSYIDSATSHLIRSRNADAAIAGIRGYAGCQR